MVPVKYHNKRKFAEVAFTFDYAFNVNSEQSVIFEETTRDLIDG